MELFHDTSLKTSAIVTKNYSNSFYLSTLLLDKRVKTAIHSIYGFVRFACNLKAAKQCWLDTFGTPSKGGSVPGLSRL